MDIEVGQSSASQLSDIDPNRETPEDRRKRLNREARKRYYVNNRERILEREKLFRDGHKEQLRASYKKYRQSDEGKAKKEKYEQENAENLKAKRREWIIAHPEKGRESTKRWKERNPSYERKKHIRRKYGLTLEALRALEEEQNNLCALCQKPETIRDRSGGIRPLSIDHDHISGEIRGLLCHRCNAALGLLNDSPELLRAAALYVENGGSL